MKLAVITELPAEHFYFWNDGLKAALNYLVSTEGWDIDIFNLPSMTNLEIRQQDYDFGLYWGALSRPQHKRKIFKKTGLCFGGGPIISLNTNNFDIIFAESNVDVSEFSKMGVNVTQAFGTNTDLFRPIPLPKRIDFLYPAAFAKWKRHDLFVDYVSCKTPQPTSLAVGYMQPNGHERECYEVCINNGVMVMPWVPAEALVYLYNQSSEVVITADPEGGCQRTVLESIACGVPVTVTNKDHLKLMELADLSIIDVLTNWSHVSYAQKLKAGIESVL